MATQNISYLDAVNKCLTTVGLAPVNTIINAPPEAALARQEIDNEHHKLLSVGFRWNTDRNVTLKRNTDGEIPVSEDVIEVRIDRRLHPNVDPVVRGDRLYNLIGGTYVFEKDLDRVSVVRHLEWYELPEPAKMFIMYNAVASFASSLMPDYVQSRENQEAIRRAWVALRASDIRGASANGLRSAPAARVFHPNYRPI